MDKKTFLIGYTYSNQLLYVITTLLWYINFSITFGQCPNTTGIILFNGFRIETIKQQREKG